MPSPHLNQLTSHSEQQPFFAQTTGDPIVDRVVNMLAERVLVGLQKYGTTLSSNPAGMLEWMQHAKEEAADFVVYLERAQQELNRLAWVQSELYRMADNHITPTPGELRLLADSLGNMTTQTVKVADQIGGTP